MDLKLQCREVNVQWVSIIATLCFLVLTVSLAAQEQQSCVPEKAFAKVGRLLEKKAYKNAKAVLRHLETCPHLSPLQRFNVGWLYGKAQDFPDALKIFESVR